MRKIAIDTEMVGSGNTSILARVALVDENLSCIYDRYVAPTSNITDYRTSITGITPLQLFNGTSFSQVQRDVCRLISGCLLIGHSVADVDLKILALDHPQHNIRDVATYPPFRQYNPRGIKPSLKVLAEVLLGEHIQVGTHCPVEDAATAMKLYKKVAHIWQ